MSKKNSCLFGTPILLAFFLFFNIEKVSASLEIDEESPSEIERLISHYKSTLPTIGDTLSPETIIDFLQLFSKKDDVDGREKLIKKTRQLIKKSASLHFILPGFPFKSFNEKKVISPGEIDLADVLALTTLDHLCQEVGKIYEAGACVTIIPDAIRISCFLGVQTQRDDYIFNLRNLLPSEYLHIKEIHEFESKPTTGKPLEEVALFLSKRDADGIEKDPYIPFVRHELDCSFYYKKIKEEILATIRTQRTFRDNFPEELKESVQELSYDEFAGYLTEAIQDNDENQETYKALMRALETQFSLKTMIKKCALINAQEARQLSGYISELFGDYENYLRLSVNQHHKDISQKLPFQILLGNDRTPWHNTLFISSKKEIFLASRNHVEDGYLKEESYRGVSIKWISQSK